MHQITTLKNGLTLITVNLPHLDSVTSLVAVGAGSRYETKSISGISHFLEHMFFKGSRKYPTAQIIANLVDGIGAINNAATSKEFTFYWIKSSAKHIELSSDILASMIRDSLLQEEEIEKEKGVIAEELRMYRDNPRSFVHDLYERLQFGDQPLGWDIGGEEGIINKIAREDFIGYMDSLYSPKNMVLVYAGKLPKDINQIAQNYFLDLSARGVTKFKPYQKTKQNKPRAGVYYKETDQANIVLGVEAYPRDDKRRYAARILAAILGEGMSSRLFMEVREKRGLAYSVNADIEPYSDTGAFTVYAGLKLEKVIEGLEVIKAELETTVKEKVSEEELKKAKEMVRGRLAIRQESTNFLAEYFGTYFVLDREIETFDDYLKKIDQVTAEDVRDVAKNLFQKDKFNLQTIGPFKSDQEFLKTLNK